MDIAEVCKRYQMAKARYEKELRTIEEEYASSKYPFKEGDVVIFKNVFYKEPTRCVVETMHYLSAETIFKSRYGNLSDNINISGYMVDEDGYYIAYFKDGNQRVGVGFRADDVIEVTKIRPKERFR